MTEKQQAISEETEQETPEQIVDPSLLSGVYLSLNEAARQTGISKGTISKDAKSGSKLQWHDQPDGTRKLHAAEVFRLYENRIRLRNLNSRNSSVDVQLTEKQQAISEETEQETPHDAVRLAVLEEKIKSAEQLLQQQQEQFAERLKATEQFLASLQEHNQDLKRERDNWREEAQSIKLLMSPPATPDSVSNTPPAAKPSWWKRLFT